MDPRSFSESMPGRVIRTRRDYWAFMPNPLPPKLVWSSDLVASLSRAENMIGRLGGIGWALPNPHLLLNPFIRREAVLSSRIEGTRASLADIYAYEAGQLSLFETSDDIKEILNYVRALEYGLERIQTLPLSLRLICEIHARLMDGVRGQHAAPGEFRKTQNWIGPPGCTLNDAAYVPPPVPEMKEALSSLESYLYEENGLPSLVRLGLIHYQFEAIHPFVDGNGRIGRLMLVLLLCLWGMLPTPLLYLSAYFERHRQEYYELLLAVSRTGDWTRWLTFFLNGVSTQASDAALRALKLQALRETYRAKYQQEGVPVGVLHLVDLLFRRPYLGVSDAVADLNHSFSTVQRYVDFLVDKGVLREVTGQARNRIYRADEIMQAIEGDLPPTDDAGLDKNNLDVLVKA